MSFCRFADALIMRKMNLTLFILCLVCFQRLAVSLQTENNIPPTCTNSMRGLPACDFKRSFCGVYISYPDDNGNLRWKRGTRVEGESENYSIDHDWQPKAGHRQDSFLFLDVKDPSIPINSTAVLMGTIYNPHTIAVCIEFHYATTTDTDSIPAISVYNEVKGERIFIGQVKNNSQGHWQKAHFESCVGTKSKIQFVSSKISANSLVGLDYIKITESKMSCMQTNAYTFNSAKNVTPFSTKPTKSPTISSSQDHYHLFSTCTNSMKGLPVCTFKKSLCGTYKTFPEDKGNLIWKRGTSVAGKSDKYSIDHDWQPKVGHKPDSFVYLDVSDSKVPVGSKAVLRGTIGNPDVQAVCLEFHYATTSDREQPPLISIYNEVGGQLDLIGEVKKNTNGNWERAFFEACVGTLSKIQFISEKVSENSLVGLDYIKITESHMRCDTITTIKKFTTPMKNIEPTNPSDVTKPAKLFKTTIINQDIETSTTALSTEALTTLGNTSLTTVPQTSTATTKTTISSSTSTTTGATRTVTSTTKTTVSKSTPTSTSTSTSTTTEATTPVTATTALDDTTTSVNSQDFTCNLTSFSIDVHVPLDVAPNSKLTLRDKSCELKSDGRNYVIHFRFDECGSSVSYFSDRVYINNDINVHKDLGPISAPIVFDSDYKINIKCSLERKKLIEGSFQTVTRDPITEENSHHVNIHHTQSILKEFRTEKYEDEITDFPAKVPINREIFMELSLNKQQDNLGIEIVNCVATPTTDPNDLLSYQLIANGCPSSPVVHLMPSGSVVKRRFKVQAFHFSGPSNTDNKVYIHCQIKYCLIDVCAIPACRRRRSALVGRQATKSRQLKAKRRRRNLIGSSDSHSVFLGIGPLTVE